MALAKTFQHIVNSIRSRIRSIRPDLDTKPGSVVRDGFVDPSADQLAALYGDLDAVSQLQSILFAANEDLDNLLSNYGLVRNAAIEATGVIYLTKSTLTASDRIVIENGTIINTRGSIPVDFEIVGSYIMSGANLSTHRATALQIQRHLDALSISDEYAIAVNVRALIAGSNGNKGIYSIRNGNIIGINNFFNIASTFGGGEEESDSLFRSRGVLALTGNDTGTDAGYKRIALDNNSVTDALVVGPGNIYMTRDGTIVTDSVIVIEGTGGKVDVWILGQRLISDTESYTYNDQSGNNDSTDVDNDHKLGNDNLVTGDQPRQPVDEITAVTGIIGSESNTYINGINYQLIKDIEQAIPSDQAASANGFDRLRWLTSEISISREQIIKGRFHNIDGLTHTSVSNITNVVEDLNIVSEYALGNDTFFVTTLHNPIASPTRVHNVTTNETYLILSFVAITGIIEINGIKAPTPTDLLQVDYIWQRSFDSLTEYVYDSNISSIDWSNSGKLTHSNHAIILLDSVILGSFQTVVLFLETIILNNGSNWNTVSPWLFTLSNETIADITAVYNYSAIITDEIIADDLTSGVAIQLNNGLITNSAGSEFGEFSNSSVVVKGHNFDIANGDADDGFSNFTLPSYVANSALSVSNQNGTDQGFNRLSLFNPGISFIDSSVFFFKSGGVAGNTADSFPWLATGTSISLTNYTLTDVLPEDGTWVANQFKNAWLIPNINNLNNRYRIISNTTNVLTIESNPDRQMVVDGASSGDTYLISYVEVVGTPTSLEYSVNYITGSVTIGGAELTTSAILVDYKYRKVLTEREVWTFGGSLASDEYLIDYTNGLLKIGSIARGHAISYMFRESYSLESIELPLHVGSTLNNNQFKLDTTANNNKYTSIDADVIKVDYSYRIPASAGLDVETPLVIPTHLKTTISGTTASTGEVLFTGTSAQSVDTELVIQNDDGYIVTIDGVANMLGGFIGAVIRIKNVTQNVVYDLTTYYIDNATYDAFVVNEGYGSFDTFIGYGDEAYGDESLLEANQILISNILNAVSPASGDILEVDYIWVKENDTEILRFSAAGTQITVKRFWSLNAKIAITPGIQHSGFANEDGTTPTIRVLSYNQPGTYRADEEVDGTWLYFVDYNYAAPRENEAITITYNYDIVIPEVQDTIDQEKDVSADVLAKAAIAVLIDITTNIQLSTNVSSVTATATLESELTTLLTAVTLGGSLQESDIISVLAAVQGVDSVTISLMARSGETGKTNITLTDTEYTRAGILTLNVTEVI